MSSSEFKIDLKFFSTGIDEVINGFSKLKTAMEGANAGTTSLAKSTESLGQKTEKEKPNLLQLGSAFGTVTAAGWSLYNSYDNLEKIKAASAKADVTAQKSALAVEAAEKRLTDTIKKYGAGSAEAQKATTELAVAKENLTNKMEMAEIKAGDVTEAYAQFATTLPTMVLSVVSAGTAFGTMVQQMGGVHKIAPMVSNSFQAVGGGIKSLMMAGGGLGLLLTVIATAFILLATNAFGVRDAFNAFGKAVGDALPFLKPLLDLIGGAANWFLNLINPMQQASAQLDTLGTSATDATTPIGSVETALTALEEQAVATGDATKLSIENQITLYKQLGTEAETLQLALTAQLQLRTDAEEEHSEKYAEFVEAMEDEDEKLRDSMGLTKEEFDKFYEEWQKDIADFAKEFQTQVDNIKKNFETFAAEGRKEQTSTAEKILEIEKAIQEAYLNMKSSSELSKEAYKEQMTAIADLEREHARLMGSMSKQALDAAMDFKEFTTIGVDSMALFRQEALGGNFQEAIKAIETAFDDVPAKYRSNFEPIMGIITSPLLDADVKVQAIVTDWNTLDPYKSFVVGQVEYSRAMALVGSDLDELTAFALRNATSATDMDEAWGLFVGSLTENQKQLPIVKTAIQMVNAGLWDGEKAFQVVAAAGQELSTILGNDVTVSFETLQKTIVDLPGPTKAVFATINGEFVKLGEIADTELVSGATSVTKSMTTTEEQAATLGTEVDTALGKQAPEAIKKMVTDGNTQFVKMVSNMETMKTGIIDKKPVIIGAFEEIAKGITSAWDTAMKGLQSAWDGFVSYVTGGGGGGGETMAQTGDKLFQDMMAKFNKSKTQNVELSPAEIQKLFSFPESQPEELTQNLELTDYTTQTNALTQFVTFVSKKTTEISAMFLTMKNSVTATMTQLQTVLGAFATTAMGTIATAVSTQTTLVSAHFLTMKNSVTITITALQTLLGAFASTTLSTIATAVSTQTTVISAAFLTMKTSVTTQIIALQTLLGAFASTTLTTVGAAVTQQTTTMSASFLTMKTSIALSIAGIITEITKLTTTTATQFAKIDTSTKTTGTGFTTLGTTVSTQTTAMTTKINSFSSAMVSAMDKITKSMDTAKKSADALKKSIDALKDKTITITTRYVTSGSPAGQHGYQGIIGAPGNVGGVKVGEGFRPELITVTPLTRGTGNHYGATMGGGFGSPGGRGGGEVVNNITVVLDGRVIQRFVEKTALAGIGMQI